MTDTIRTIAALQALLADAQPPGSITPQIIRDMLVSLDDEVQSTRQSAPTLEELETRAFLPTSIAATANVYIGSTNFAQRIGAMTFAFSAAIAASDADYWKIDLQRNRNNTGWVTITSMTTKVTGGSAIVANSGYSFDNAVWPPFLRYLNKGDVLRLVFTKTGTPAALADGVAVIRYEPDVLPFIRDTFTRADNTVTLGLAETGQSWSVLALPNASAASVFGVKSNAASIHVHSSGSRDYAVIDAGFSDCSVSAIVNDVANCGIGVRLASGSPLSDPTKHPNGYVHNASQFFRSDNGTLVLLFGLSPVLVNGDVVTIDMSGSLFTVYKNGVAVGSGSDATYVTTKHGIRNSGTTVDTALWDDFAIAV